MSVKCLGIGSVQYSLIYFFQLCTWFASLYVFLSWNYSDFSLTYFSNCCICTGILSILTWELLESLKPTPETKGGALINPQVIPVFPKVSESLLYAVPCMNSLYEGPFFSGFLVASYLFYM